MSHSPRVGQLIHKVRPGTLKQLQINVLERLRHRVKRVETFPLLRILLDKRANKGQKSEINLVTKGLSLKTFHF
jgi:hypothetical protein